MLAAKKLLCCALSTCCMAISLNAAAQVDTGANTTGQTSPGGPGCYDAEVFSGKLISGVCWDCVFPIVISRVVIAGDKDRIPDGAADGSVLGACMCRDNLGMPSFGVKTSLWQPARLVELQRQSGCSGVLGGLRFPFNRLYQGTEQKLSQQSQSKNDGKTYRHYHYYSFPLMTMMDMWLPGFCNPGGFMDLDIMYLSEIDPTWNNDEIAFFTHPEAALIASPLGAISCIPDAFGANVGKPIKELYWCAGSWGVLFPTSGSVLSRENIMMTTSLMGARALYALHRRGLEWRSIGDDVMCGGEMSPYLPKNQYRFQVFHPVSETENNHVLGEMLYTWALGRTIPAVGEDPLFLIWRWIDCCNTSS